MSDEIHMPESDVPTTPGMPSPLETRVLEEGRALLGQSETEGDNWGPVVRTVASPFLSPERLATFAPGMKRAGKLQWCALFACYCWWKATMPPQPPGRPPLPPSASWFHRFADSEVSDLWQRLGDEGWVWEKGGKDPQPADLLFFVKVDPRTGAALRKPDDSPAFRHVGLVQRVEGGDLVSLEGNAGSAVRERRYHLSEVQIFGFGRPQPT